MRKKKMMNRYHYIKNIVMLATMMLAASCGSDGFDDEPQNVAESPQEIHLNAEVWRMMDGTRAFFYAIPDGLQSSGFGCVAYLDGTQYFSSNVIWYNSKWKFEHNKYYWPASGTLKFYGYSAVPSCFTSHTHASGNPQFTCTLPMTSDGGSDITNDQDDLLEFVYAKATGTKAANGETGVTLNFQHPFTRINLKLSSTQASIQINTITFKSIKNNGNYNDGTWTLTGDATNFVVTANRNYSADDAIGSYLMIPQNWTGNIEVEATWVDWGVSLKHTLTTKVDAVTWAPGTSYTYTFTITETELIVSSSKYTEQW